MSAKCSQSLSIMTTSPSPPPGELLNQDISQPLQSSTSTALFHRRLRRALWSPQQSLGLCRKVQAAAPSPEAGTQGGSALFQLRSLSPVDSSVCFRPLLAPGPPFSSLFSAYCSSPASGDLGEAALLPSALSPLVHAGFHWHPLYAILFLFF